MQIYTDIYYKLLSPYPNGISVYIAYSFLSQSFVLLSGKKTTKQQHPIVQQT